jgi:anti-sigma B factor antagonist
MATGLQIVFEDSSVRVIRLMGELDLDTVGRSRGSLETAVANADLPIVVDLSDLTFCDSSGVRALLALHRMAAASGGEFWVRNPTRAVAQVLNLTGADRLLLARDDGNSS